MTLSDDCWAYYKCEDSSTTATDETSNSYDLAWYDNVASTTGKISNGFDFPGTNNSRLEGSFGSDTTNRSGTWSVSLWIYPDTSTASYIIYGKWSGGGNHRSVIYGYQSGQVNLYTTAGYPTGDSADTAMSVNTSQWNHVVYTWNATGGLLKGYVNGTKVVDLSSVSFYEPGSQTGWAVQIGTAPFDAKLDEMGFFNRTLSQTDVDTLYNSSSGLTYPFSASSSTNMKVNISDTWKDIDAVKVNISDSWKDVASMQVNIGDSWKTIF